MSFRKMQFTLMALPCWLPPVAAAAHGITEGDQQIMLAGGNLNYLILGAKHMLTGLDHLLFIFGIIFFLTGFRDIVKYITVFTLGHSITLVFATLMGISANHYLVDAIIATSVCYKGFENLDGFNKYLGKTAPNLLLVIFGFGLIHGFGLSTRLQQLPLGESGLILRILSFNLGVELGQILALLGMVAIIAGWRRSQSFQRFTIYSNRGLIVAGALLFLMQIHNYGHSLNLEFFGMDSTSRSQVSFSSSSTSIALSKAMADYDQAFVERDVLALWDLFSEDIVLIEQGSQNVGRDDALGKHLGPDLKAFLQMAAEYKDVNVLEFDGAAIRTRHFIIQGKLPNRLFHARGFETQNWVIQSGKWKLVHMHWSFPVR